MFSEQSIQKTLGLSILISIIIFLIYGADLLNDELEHLRAGYLVSLEQHPYSDFFEHHHPLLWWIWAPIIKVLPHNQLLLFYISRTLTTIVSCGSAFYIFKIAERFFGGKNIAIWTLLIYFSFYFAQTTSVVFKPNAFMWFCYLCGLYHFCLYINNKQQKHLWIAATTFAISFMFLQTALFLLLPLGILALYLLYKNPTSWKDYTLGAIPALLLLSLFLIYIHHTSGIIPYYQRCWILNSHIFKTLIYEQAFLPKFIFFIFIGYFAYGYQIKTRQATVYTHFMALLLTTSCLKNIIYNAPFPNYFQPEALAIAFLLASLIPQMPKLVKNYLIAALFAFNILNIMTSLYFLPNKPHLQEVAFLSKSKNVTVYPPFLNTYTPHYPFYWFFPLLEALDNHLFHHSFDINKYIEQNKIDYVAYTFDDNLLLYKVNIQTSSTNLPTQITIPNDILHQHFIDSEILKKQYDLLKTPISDIFKRKSNQ